MRDKPKIPYIIPYFKDHVALGDLTPELKEQLDHFDSLISAIENVSTHRIGKSSQDIKEQSQQFRARLDASTSTTTTHDDDLDSKEQSTDLRDLRDMVTEVKTFGETEINATQKAGNIIKHVMSLASELHRDELEARYHTFPGIKKELAQAFTQELTRGRIALERLHQRRLRADLLAEIKEDNDSIAQQLRNPEPFLIGKMQQITREFDQLRGSVPEPKSNKKSKFPLYEKLKALQDEKTKTLNAQLAGMSQPSSAEKDARERQQRRDQFFAYKIEMLLIEFEQITGLARSSTVKENQCKRMEILIQLIKQADIVPPIFKELSKDIWTPLEAEVARVRKSFVVNNSDANEKALKAVDEAFQKLSKIQPYRDAAEDAFVAQYHQEYLDQKPERGQKSKNENAFKLAQAKLIKALDLVLKENEDLLVTDAHRSASNSNTDIVSKLAKYLRNFFQRTESQAATTSSSTKKNEDNPQAQKAKCLELINAKTHQYKASLSSIPQDPSKTTWTADDRLQLEVLLNIYTSTFKETLYTPEINAALQTKRDDADTTKQASALRYKFVAQIFEGQGSQARCKELLSQTLQAYKLAIANQSVNAREDVSFYATRLVIFIELYKMDFGSFTLPGFDALVDEDKDFDSDLFDEAFENQLTTTPSSSSQQQFKYVKRTAIVEWAELKTDIKNHLTYGTDNNTNQNAALDKLTFLENDWKSIQGAYWKQLHKDIDVYTYCVERSYNNAVKALQNSNRGTKPGKNELPLPKAAAEFYYWLRKYEARFIVIPKRYRSFRAGLLKNSAAGRFVVSKETESELSFNPLSSKSTLNTSVFENDQQKLLDLQYDFCVHQHGINYEKSIADIAVKAIYIDQLIKKFEEALRGQLPETVRVAIQQKRAILQVKANELASTMTKILIASGSPATTSTAGNLNASDYFTNAVDPSQLAYQESTTIGWNFRTLLEPEAEAEKPAIKLTHGGIEYDLLAELSPTHKGYLPLWSQSVLDACTEQKIEFFTDAINEEKLHEALKSNDLITATLDYCRDDEDSLDDQERLFNKHFYDTKIDRVIDEIVPLKSSSSKNKLNNELKKLFKGQTFLNALKKKYITDFESNSLQTFISFISKYHDKSEQKLEDDSQEASIPPNKVTLKNLEQILGLWRIPLTYIEGKGFIVKLITGTNTFGVSNHESIEDPVAIKLIIKINTNLLGLEALCKKPLQAVWFQNESFAQIYFRNASIAKKALKNLEERDFFNKPLTTDALNAIKKEANKVFEQITNSITAQFKDVFSKFKKVGGAGKIDFDLNFSGLTDVRQLINLFRTLQSFDIAKAKQFEKSTNFAAYFFQEITTSIQSYFSKSNDILVPNENYEKLTAKCDQYAYTSSQQAAIKYFDQLIKTPSNTVRKYLLQDVAAFKDIYARWNGTNLEQLFQASSVPNYQSTEPYLLMKHLETLFGTDQLKDSNALKANCLAFLTSFVKPRTNSQNILLRVFYEPQELKSKIDEESRSRENIQNLIVHKFLCKVPKGPKHKESNFDLVANKSLEINYASALEHLELLYNLYPSPNDSSVQKHLVDILQATKIYFEAYRGDRDYLYPEMLIRIQKFENDPDILGRDNNFVGLFAIKRLQQLLTENQSHHRSPDGDELALFNCVADYDNFHTFLWGKIRAGLSPEQKDDNDLPQPIALDIRQSKKLWMIICSRKKGDFLEDQKKLLNLLIRERGDQFQDAISFILNHVSARQKKAELEKSLCENAYAELEKHCASHNMDVPNAPNAARIEHYYKLIQKHGSTEVKAKALGLYLKTKIQKNNGLIDELELITIVDEMLNTVHGYERAHNPILQEFQNGWLKEQLEQAEQKFSQHDLQLIHIYQIAAAYGKLPEQQPRAVAKLIWHEAIKNPPQETKLSLDDADIFNKTLTAFNNRFDDLVSAQARPLYNTEKASFEQQVWQHLLDLPRVDEDFGLFYERVKHHGNATQQANVLFKYLCTQQKLIPDESNFVKYLDDMTSAATPTQRSDVIAQLKSNVKGKIKELVDNLKEEEELTNSLNTYFNEQLNSLLVPSEEKINHTSKKPNSTLSKKSQHKVTSPLDFNNKQSRLSELNQKLNIDPKFYVQIGLLGATIQRETAAQDATFIIDLHKQLMQLLYNSGNTAQLKIYFEAVFKNEPWQNWAAENPDFFIDLISKKQPFELVRNGRIHQSSWSPSRQYIAMEMAHIAAAQPAKQNVFNYIYQEERGHWLSSILLNQQLYLLDDQDENQENSSGENIKTVAELAEKNQEFFEKELANGSLRSQVNAASLIKTFGTEIAKELITATDVYLQKHNIPEQMLVIDLKVIYPFIQRLQGVEIDATNNQEPSTTSFSRSDITQDPESFKGTGGLFCFRINLIQHLRDYILENDQTAHTTLLREIEGQNSSIRNVIRPEGGTTAPNTQEIESFLTQQKESFNLLLQRVRGKQSQREKLRSDLQQAHTAFARFLVKASNGKYNRKENIKEDNPEFLRAGNAYNTAKTAYDQAEKLIKNYQTVRVCYDTLIMLRAHTEALSREAIEIHSEICDKLINREMTTQDVDSVFAATAVPHQNQLLNECRNDINNVLTKHALSSRNAKQNISEWFKYKDAQNDLERKDSEAGEQKCTFESLHSNSKLLTPDIKQVHLILKLLPTANRLSLQNARQRPYPQQPSVNSYVSHQKIHRDVVFAQLMEALQQEPADLSSKIINRQRATTLMTHASVDQKSDLSNLIGSRIAKPPIDKTELENIFSQAMTFKVFKDEQNSEAAAIKLNAFLRPTSGSQLKRFTQADVIYNFRNQRLSHLDRQIEQISREFERSNKDEAIFKKLNALVCQRSELLKTISGDLDQEVNDYLSKLEQLGLSQTLNGEKWYFIDSRPTHLESIVHDILIENKIDSKSQNFEPTKAVICKALYEIQIRLYHEEQGAIDPQRLVLQSLYEILDPTIHRSSSISSSFYRDDPKENYQGCDKHLDTIGYYAEHVFPLLERIKNNNFIGEGISDAEITNIANHPRYGKQNCKAFWEDVINQLNSRNEVDDQHKTFLTAQLGSAAQIAALQQQLKAKEREKELEALKTLDAVAATVKAMRENIALEPGQRSERSPLSFKISHNVNNSTIQIEELKSDFEDQDKHLYKQFFANLDKRPGIINLKTDLALIQAVYVRSVLDTAPEFYQKYREALEKGIKGRSKISILTSTEEQNEKSWVKYNNFLEKCIAVLQNAIKKYACFTHEHNVYGCFSYQDLINISTVKNGGEKPEKELEEIDKFFRDNIKRLEFRDINVTFQKFNIAELKENLFKVALCRNIDKSLEPIVKRSLTSDSEEARAVICEVTKACRCLEVSNSREWQTIKPMSDWLIDAIFNDVNLLKLILNKKNEDDNQYSIIRRQLSQTFTQNGPNSFPKTKYHKDNLISERGNSEAVAYLLLHRIKLKIVSPRRSESISDLKEKVISLLHEITIKDEWLSVHALLIEIFKELELKTSMDLNLIKSHQGFQQLFNPKDAPSITHEGFNQLFPALSTKSTVEAKDPENAGLGVTDYFSPGTSASNTPPHRNRSGGRSSGEQKRYFSSSRNNSGNSIPMIGNGSLSLSSSAAVSRQNSTTSNNPFSAFSSPNQTPSSSRRGTVTSRTRAQPAAEGLDSQGPNRIITHRPIRLTSMSHLFPLEGIPDEGREGIPHERTVANPSETAEPAMITVTAGTGGQSTRS